MLGAKRIQKRHVLNHKKKNSKTLPCYISFDSLLPESLISMHFVSVEVNFQSLTSEKS